MRRAQRTRAGRVHDAVRAAEIEAVRNAPGNDVAKQTGEGIFLPFDILLPNALNHVLRDVIGDSGILQGFPPIRMPKPRSERNDKFLRAGDAENHAGAVAVEFAPQIACVAQGFLRHDEAQQLRRVGRFERVRDDAEFERVKFNRRQKSALRAIRFIAGFLIAVEIVCRVPMRGGNVGNRVAAFFQERPIFLQVAGLRKHAADANNGNRRGVMRDCLSFFLHVSLCK